MINTPFVESAPPLRRQFAAFPVAVQAIIVNADEQLLLLSSPRKTPAGAWQTVSGGLEAGETVLAGALREVAEEVGPAVRLRPLGVAHTHSFSFDSAISHMISVYYLMHYLGGDIVPGDDMAGSDWRWWHVEELLSANVPLHPSTDYPGLLRRAVELHRLWAALPSQTWQLQAPLSP